MKDESYIHLRVPAVTKARWVRDSRAAGMRLTDWIIRRADMKTAQDIIDLIREAGAEDDKAILAALEDGAALAGLGINDADQEAVEEAHAIIKARL